jgi:DNA polymerase-3 subunit epsilon
VGGVTATLWHRGVMCAFDLETTSADVETARIVTACVVHVDGSGVIPPEAQTWLIDPGVEIPAEASAIHGITTEHAREHGEVPGPALRDISGALARSARSGIPVVAFNAPYDLTVLDRETRRNELEPFTDQFPHAATVIDPYVLDKHLDPYRKGKRTLSAACEHYGVRIDGAHDAAADAIAAVRVAWKIAQAYPRIGAMPLPDLRELQVRAKAEQSRSFQEYLRRQGKTEVIDGSWPLKTWTEAAA